jgi:hypothetical protein
LGCDLSRANPSGVEINVNCAVTDKVTSKYDYLSPNAPTGREEGDGWSRNISIHISTPIHGVVVDAHLGQEGKRESEEDNQH